MAAPTLTPALRAEYEQLFDSCTPDPARLADVDGLVRKITAAQARYESVGVPLGVPWYFIGLVHCMEAGLRFDRHLHNGDPLTARTVRVPPDRPRAGTPPFSWELSATDALIYEGLDQCRDWTLAGILHRLEAYNGFGYRKHHPDVLSPYLWSFSNHYTCGKYVQDGVWSPTAISQQCGAAVLLHRMVEAQGLLIPTSSVHVGSPASTPIPVGTLPTLPTPPISPPVPPIVIAPPPLASDGAPQIRFYAGGPPLDDVRILQLFLNDVEGGTLRMDGKAGRLTSDAVKRVLGRYLVGDPRG